MGIADEAKGYFIRNSSGSIMKLTISTFVLFSLICVHALSCVPT